MLRNIIFYFSFFLISCSIYASHYMGLDVYYDYLGNQQYRIIVKAYGDCASSLGVDPLPNAGGLVFNLVGQGGGCTLPTQIGAWQLLSYQEVTPICPGYPTKCNTSGASLDGVREAVFQGIFDFSGVNCTVYNIEVSQCCRNNAITNVTQPGSRYIYSNVATINLAQPNSSPRFLQLPTPYICFGEQFSFNQGAVDPDGDSLVYRIDFCQGGTTAATSGSPVVYVPPATNTAPILSNPPMFITPSTGDIFITPSAIQTSIMCVFVDEYRNGVLLGTIVRDIQVKVINCGANRVPQLTGITEDPNQPTYQFVDTICAGVPATLYITSQDSNVGQFLTLTWNNGIPAASFSSTPGFNAYGTFTWNNPIASTQPYTFTVRVQDDYCPINGYRDYTFLLYVQGGPFTARDSIESIVCNDVVFTAVIDSGGVPPFTFEWNGDGNLNFNIFRFDSTFSHSYPGPGTYYYTLTVTDALGCKEIIADSVTIINASVADAGIDTTICNNAPLVLGTTPLPNYRYRWRPGNFLSDSTIAQPTLTYLNNGINPVTVSYQVIATDTLTGCSATDFVNITIKPEITTFIAGPSSLCLGDSATLAAPLSASYSWSTGDTVQTIKVAPTDTTTYTLITTDFEGCPTTPATLTINVIPPIQVEITGIDTICAGDSTLLTCTPATTYLWSTGETTQSIWVKPNATTSYWVNTTHSGCNGLPDTLTVVVNPVPTINIGKSKLSACQQEVVTFYYIGNASNQTIYDWSVTHGTILSGLGTDTITAAFDSTGTQFIYLTINDKGCVVKDTQQIFINPTPIISAGPDTSICKGTAVYSLKGQILAGTSCQYFWSPSYGLDNPNALNPNAFPDTTTTYYFYAVCNGCTSSVDSVTVFINPRPIVQITNPLLTLCAGDTAQFLTNTSGSSPFVYEWLPAAGLSNPTVPNPLVFPTTTTTYRLVVKDSANCTSDTLFAQVNVNEAPVLDAGDNDTLCKGQGTFLQPSVAGNGSFNYQWSPSAGLSNPNIANPFAIPTQTTTYYLQVTSNLTGCVSNIDSVTIVVLDLQAPFAGNDTAICFGTSIQIGSDPIPGRQYFWTPTTGLNDPNISNPIATPSFTTTYTLQYTENGCLSAVDEVTITVLGRPTVNAGDSVETCPGIPVQLQANASGVPGPYTFTWFPTTGLDNPNAQNPIASPLVTTKYYVYASAQGCEGNTDSVIVFVKPTPTVDADTTNSEYHICQGDTVKIPGKVTSILQPVHIRWWAKENDHTQWISDTTIANPFIVPQVSGTYYLQADAGGCYSLLDSVYIKVTPKLNVKKFPENDAIVCKGTEIPIVVGNIPAGATVMWLNPIDSSLISNDSILFINPEVNTTYLIYVVHEVCEYWDSINVVVYPQPKAQFRAGFNESCNSLEVSFSDISEHAVAWMWDFGDGSSVVNVQHPTHVYTQPGIYTVTLRIKGLGTCADSAIYQQSFTVKEGIKAKFTSSPDAPVTMILPETYVQFMDSSQNALAWFWDFGDGYSSTEQNPKHQYLSTGQFFVNLQVIDTNGCVDSYAKGPYIITEPKLKVYNVFTPNGDGVNDFFRLPYDGHESYEFSVYDRWGVRLYITNNPQDRGWNGLMPNGKEASDGVYFYNLKIGENLQNGSFSLMR